MLQASLFIVFRRFSMCGRVASSKFLTLSAHLETKKGQGASSSAKPARILARRGSIRPPHRGLTAFQLRKVGVSYGFLEVSSRFSSSGLHLVMEPARRKLFLDHFDHRPPLCSGSCSTSTSRIALAAALKDLDHKDRYTSPSEMRISSYSIYRQVIHDPNYLVYNMHDILC